MLSNNVMTQFAESRFGLSKLQEVINIYTSLMKRIVLPGDFPNSASNYAQFPGIITFAKEVTEPDDREPRYIYVDPETAATPGPGNIAKTIYTPEWITSKAETATSENPIPDPLCIYDTGEMWKHISAELQEKHVGRIHPNLCRPIYLTVPRTTPKWEDQDGELHTYAFELEPMNHDKDPWAVYVRDYNRIRNKALTTMVVDKKADEAASKEHGYDKNAPKPMKPLICSYEDAEEMLAITLEDGVARRMLSTSLPRRGSDLHISGCLNKCLVEYATKTKQLYKDLFFHIAACEMTIYCAKQQTPVWSTENLMSQDPQQNRPEPDVNTFFPRGKHSAFNHNLELQEITYQLTHVSREHLRYQLLITSLTTYISAIISTQESILHHVCQAFDKVLDSNYPKQRNNEPIKPPENETIINLRMCLAGLNYYAASKARNSIQTGIQRSYFNVVCQAIIMNGIPFPILTELLGFNLSITTEQQIKLDELIERQKNIRTQVSTYNTQVHGAVPSSGRV
jgi:hypothetical protein